MASTKVYVFVDYDDNNSNDNISDNQRHVQQGFHMTRMLGSGAGRVFKGHNLTPPSLKNFSWKVKTELKAIHGR